jgi:hypothetical protein
MLLHVLTFFLLGIKKQLPFSFIFLQDKKTVFQRKAQLQNTGYIRENGQEHRQ